MEGPPSSANTLTEVVRASTNPTNRAQEGQTNRRQIRVIQVNLNECKVAHDLLMQLVLEKEVDIALVSEPNLKVSGGPWAISENGLTGIWVKDPNTAKLLLPKPEGITGVTIDGVLFLSTYFSGNKSNDDYSIYLEQLGGLIRGRGGDKVIVGGDLNAKSVMWGEKGGRDREERRRVKITESFIAQEELEVANVGKEPTCVRDNGSSIVDVTLNTEGVEIEGWRVMNKESRSDHRYITFQVNLGDGTRRRNPLRGVEASKGWKVHKEALPELERALKNNMEGLDIEAYATAEEAAETYSEAVIGTCNDVLPLKKPPPMKKSVYWWNEEIANIRKECSKIRRKLKKTKRNSGKKRALIQTLREKRKELRNAIRSSKRQKWEELLGELNSDPWSKAYRIVMDKLGGKKAELGGNVDIDETVGELFPRDEEDWYSNTKIVEEDGEESPSPFTPEEMDAAIGSLAKKMRKAPGPDNIVNEIVRACYRADPVKMLEMYNRCLKEQIFPKIWKKGRLVLIPKPESTKVRPITLLSTLGKLYETMINNRIKRELDESNYLSGMQFGFREGRSTGDALKILKKKIRGARRSKQFGVVISFDIRNAFNTIKWGSIMSGMKKANLPKYLQRIVREYGNERVLIYENSHGETKEYLTNRGVPQGSVLGPTLWILTYNIVLRLAESESRLLLGFADDTLLIVTANIQYEVEDVCNIIIEEIRAVVEELGCVFAPEKTQAIFISPKRKVTADSLNITVAGVKVVFTRQFKYLGVIVDDQLNYAKHIEYVTNKARKVCGKLSGITKNLKGPKEKKRKLYTTVVNQVMLYAAPVWGENLAQQHKDRLNGVQRLANLRQIQAYRNVSGDSAGALSGNPPLDLLAEEACSLDEEVTEIKLNEVATKAEKRGAIFRAKKRARRRTLDRWNQRWQEKVNNWTKKLCDDLDGINRRNLRNTFRTTQLLTGKGVFNEYRKAIGKCESDRCWYCPETVDTPEHTMFTCDRWNEARAAVASKVEFRPDGGLLARLTESKEVWRAFQDFAEIVMTTKEEEERRIEARQREERRRAQGQRCSVL